VVAHLRDAAARACGGRIAFVTEGGYDLRALGSCLLRTVALAGDPSATVATPARGSTARAEESLEAARACLTPYWRGI
jgi:acetoin utilization deacetylase AcuC-like enzyme